MVHKGSDVLPHKVLNSLRIRTNVLKCLISYNISL